MRGVTEVADKIQKKIASRFFGQGDMVHTRSLQRMTNYKIQKKIASHVSRLRHLCNDYAFSVQNSKENSKSTPNTVGLTVELLPSQNSKENSKSVIVP